MMKWLSRSVMTIALIGGALLTPYSPPVLATSALVVANAEDPPSRLIDHYFYSVHQDSTSAIFSRTANSA
jgi:hypothetical protein